MKPFATTLISIVCAATLVGTPDAHQLTPPAHIAYQDALTVTATAVDGRAALGISGTASAGAVVNVTLYGLVSKDLPTILLSRTNFVANADGRYGGVVAIAPLYFSNSIIRVVASAQGAEAVTTARVAQPNRSAASLPDNLHNN